MVEEGEVGPDNVYLTLLGQDKFSPDLMATLEEVNIRSTYMHACQWDAELLCFTVKSNTSLCEAVAASVSCLVACVQLAVYFADGFTKMIERNLALDVKKSKLEDNVSLLCVFQSPSSLFQSPLRLPVSFQSPSSLFQSPSLSLLSLLLPL